MKKNILIIGLVGILGISSSLTSCAPDYETEFNVSTLVVPDKSQAPITFSLKGGEQTIEVQTNVPLDKWEAACNAEWCKIEKQEGKVIVVASSNEAYKSRKAVVTVQYGHQSYSINVSQFGLDPAILVGNDMLQEGHIEMVDGETRSLTIPVSANMELDNIVIPDTCSWIRLSKQEKVTGARAAEGIIQQKLTFSLDEQTDTVARYCTIILQSSQNYNYVCSFLIKQHERGYIVDRGEALEEYTVKAMGETLTIPFKVNGPEKAYTYEIIGDAKSWITSAPATRSLRDAYESFVIQANIEEQGRTGEIIFRSTDPTKPNEFSVKITQDKFIPVHPNGIKNLRASAGPGCITLNWDLPNDVNFTTVKISYHDKVNTNKPDQEITISDNSVTSWNIENTFQCAGEYKFTIETYGPTGWVTDEPAVVTATSGISELKAAINLSLDMLSDNANQPGDGTGLPALIDKNIETFYHSNYTQVIDGGKAHYIQVDLKTFSLQKDFCFEYDARNNAANNGGDVKRADIYGSNTGDNWIKVGTLTYNMPTTKGGHASVTSNVSANKAYRYIRYIPVARRNQDPLVSTNADQAWFNMSNLYLYKINEHDEAWAKRILGI